MLCEDHEDARFGGWSEVTLHAVEGDTDEVEARCWRTAAGEQRHAVLGRDDVESDRIEALQGWLLRQPPTVRLGLRRVPRDRYRLHELFLGIGARGPTTRQATAQLGRAAAELGEALDAWRWFPDAESSPRVDQGGLWLALRTEPVARSRSFHRNAPRFLVPDSYRAPIIDAPVSVWLWPHAGPALPPRHLTHLLSELDGGEHQLFGWSAALDDDQVHDARTADLQRLVRRQRAAWASMFQALSLGASVQVHTAR